MLIINVKENSYLPNHLTTLSGARIAIHTQNTTASLINDGIDLTPRKSTSIGFRKVCTCLILYFGVGVKDVI